MKAKRRRHDSAFARVAIEAMKEGKTIHQIAKENDIHPSQVMEWKAKPDSHFFSITAGLSNCHRFPFQVSRFYCEI